MRLIPRDSVITFGKNLTVVKEDVEDSLLDTPEQLGADDGSFEFEKKNKSYVAAAYQDQNREEQIMTDLFADAGSPNLADDFEATAALPEDDAFETEPDVTQNDNASLLFEQRQRQYLRGRYATKTITDSNGNIIINEGMRIDDEIIDKAKEKGKLVELVMNNRA